MLQLQLVTGPSATGGEILTVNLGRASARAGDEQGKTRSSSLLDLPAMATPLVSLPYGFLDRGGEGIVFGGVGHDGCFTGSQMDGGIKTAG